MEVGLKSPGLQAISGELKIAVYPQTTCEFFVEMLPEHGNLKQKHNLFSIISAPCF